MNDEKLELKFVLEIIKSRYGSWESPNFDFVSTSLSHSPYATIVAELSSRYQVEEEMDVNDDVSFGYLISDFSSRWFLQISMLAPWALLMRIYDNGLSVVELNEELSSTESNITDILQRSNIKLLGKSLLSLPVPLHLHNTDPGSVRIYQAVFSDTEVLPWAREA
ncbi:hypothetical protein [Bremerella alba]|uniref:Uncharacterized protein n=1 Tax=Bremerella alba TaxID=980252 RepID=A0A7V9A8M9_9BACT|nr:hypothetical protein [Bremerella alba]MBA2116602.1 hypothetical protein [Bremerella alba]